VWPNCGGSSENDPVARPRSEPLSSTQLLVAAGDDDNSMRIFRVDTAASTQPVPVSQGDGNEWLPVLSPDRRTLVYSRENGDSGSFVLYTAGVDGSEHRELFDQQTPEECRKSTGRPAWIPGTEELVLRCFDRDSNLSLLRVDAHGNVLDTYLVRDGGTVLSGFGDPTVSFDGSTLVVFGDPNPRASAGSLFAIGLETGRSRLVHRCDVGLACSDAVFSPVEGRLAWREDVGAPAGGFEILTASFTSNILGPPLLLSGNAEGRDQDPMFSPDGTQVVFGHTLPGQDRTAQQLFVADVSATPNPRALTIDGLPDYQSVPAWSRR